MKINLTSALLLLGMAVLLPGGAAAQLGVEYFCCDDILDTVLSDTAFVAVGRIGDLSGPASCELQIGPSTAAPAMASQFAWENGVDYPFTLTFNATTRQAVFKLGGHILSYVTKYDIFDAIFIRVRSDLDGSSVRLSNLVLDGIVVPGNAVAIGPDGLQIMQIYGAPLADGFTLTGLAQLGWSGTPPLNSELCFQIQTANMLVVRDEDQSWGSVKTLFR